MPAVPTQIPARDQPRGPWSLDDMVEVIENWNQMAVNRRPKKSTEPKIPHVSTLLSDGQWAGSPCVVLGGGPSMKPFVERLGEFPIGTRFVGVNQSWRLCAEVIYAIDVQVFELAESTYKEEWRRKTEEGQVRITHQTNAPKGSWPRASWVGQLNTNEWGTSFEKGIVAPNNSGLAALNIADVLGCDPIVLLGFDGWHKGQPQNWHEDYPRHGSFRPKNAEMTCKRWTVNFNLVASKIRAKVFNAFVQSRYTCFPKVSFEDAVSACRQALTKGSGV